MRQRRTLISKFDSSRIALPRFAEPRALTLRAPIGRNGLEGDTHRQRDAFSERDRLLDRQARERPQHAVARFRQRLLDEALIELIPQSERENGSTLRERLRRKLGGAL